MDLKSLETFIQVAELGSFTKASDRLGFSQPTVSFHIKQLEKELGIQLFDRVGHTVCLTEGGRKVLIQAQEICRLTARMVDDGQSDKALTGVIRIAMADSFCSPLIINEFDRFRRDYPGISLKITSAGTDEMFRMLMQNEVDIVCTLDNHIYNASYVIANEEKVGAHFVCSSKNALAQEKNHTVERLLSEPFILTEKGMSYRRLLEEKLAEKSMEIAPILEIGSANHICSLVEDNLGVSFLPDYVIKDGIKAGTIVKLEVENFEVELWKQILYHRDKWMSAPMEAVLKYISEISL